MLEMSLWRMVQHGERSIALHVRNKSFQVPSYRQSVRQQPCTRPLPANCFARPLASLATALLA